MNRITLTLSGFTVLLGACGDEKAPVRSEFNADVRSPFRYEFFDAENDCGTGLQTFESLTQMCIHVQDPLRNNDCATEKRERHFDEHCTRCGGLPFGSHHSGFRSRPHRAGHRLLAARR